jgi:hypothetical protein
LLSAVRKGQTSWVPVLVKAMTPAERRGCLPALKALQKNRGDAWSRHRDGWGWDMALLVAGAGCNTAPSAAAQWIDRQPEYLLALEDVVHLLAVLSQRDAEWIGDVATRLAGRRLPTWDWREFPLVERLIRLSGCPIPTDEGFVTSWVLERSWDRRTWPSVTIADGVVATKTLPNGRVVEGTVLKGRPAKGTVVDGKVIALPAGSTLLDRLRADDLLTPLVPRLFEVPDIGTRLATAGHRGPEDNWPYVLATLAAEGLLDRCELIDGCLSRLLRGERPGNLRGFVDILNALTPTEDEQAARATTYLRLLPDGHSTVAALAQQTLIALDDAGRLDAEVLIEASRMVLCRPEKKLVRAQLSWLDKAARRDSGRCGEIVLAAAETFSHEDTSIAERALNLVGRHLRNAGTAVLPELMAAAATLAPALHARAATLLGFAEVTSDPGEPADLLPPVPMAQPLAPAPQSAAEVAEEVAVIIAGAGACNCCWPTGAGETVTVEVFERALDGLVRQAHHDREGLVKALQPLSKSHTWVGSGTWWDCTPRDIGQVVATLTGEIPPAKLPRALEGDPRGHANRSQSRFGNVLALRLMEVAARVVDDPPPFLLATPDYTTGVIDPATLVGRLKAYEEAGVEAGVADLDQALLRLGRERDPEVLAAASRLASAGGRRLSAWLRLGGLPEPSVERVIEKRSAYGRQSYRRVTVKAARVAAPIELSTPFEQLFTFDNADASGAHAHSSAVLPEHRELVAAYLMDTFADAADYDNGPWAILPVLAEAGGPAGQALHLALAYGLGARSRQSRTAAVDALLVLAARGDLDAAMLGRDLAEIVRLDGVKPNRLAESVREVSRTGAYGTVWSVLSAALPGLLGPADMSGKPRPGLADILAVGAECALRSGARGVIPEVSAVADRPGSTRLVKEARLLRDALAPAPRP